MIYQERIFTKNECEKIIGYSQTYKDHPIQLKGLAEISQKNRLTSTNDFFMKYDIFIVPMNQDTTWMFKKLFDWFYSVSNVKLIDNLPYFRCALHRYSLNDGFGRHIDLVKGYENRRYNIGVQLNENYSGGDYVCWDNNGNEILISKEVGTALAYSSKIPHEIKKITEGERWSIVIPLDKKVIIENEKNNLI